VKLLAIAALLASAAIGASWDGTRGDITIETITRYVRNDPFGRSEMIVKLKCSNLAVSAVRVTITVHSGEFTSTTSQLVELGPRRSGVATFPNTSEDRITAPPTVTVLFDGASTQF
jgi:hypothetical protein